MRTPRRFLVAAIATVSFAALGCSDSPVGPDHGPVDLNTALSEMSLTTIVPGGVGLAPASSAALVPTGCAYNATAQNFACAPVSVNGVTVTQDFALLTSTGTPQSAFDAATTDAIRQHLTASGTMTENGESMSVDMTQVMTLSGLLSGTHVLDGQQVAHLSTSGSLAFAEDVTTTIAGLVIPRHAGDYPKAGSITMVLVDASAGSSPSSALSLTMVFNGTSKVDVTTTFDGVTKRCTVDLASSSGNMACL